MATKTLNTRIQLKYDSYANWTTNNPTLLQGEIAIATIQAADNQAQNPPTVLFKVGPGAFNSLDWVSAKAADVYSWAKAATKPTYTAEEIEGLSEYIGGKVEDSDLDTRYSFEVTTDGKLKVSKTLYTLGVAGTSETVGEYDFVTPDELTEILKSYYTKSEVDALVQGAKDYADENDANTAHTHSVGAGLAKTGEGGISGIVEYSANIDVAYQNSKIYLIDKTTKETIGEGFDASAFVKDSYLKSVSYDAVTNILTFTFVDNEDNLQAISVDLNDLVDVYTADEVSLTKTGSEFSIKDGGVSTAKIADKAVTKAKLEESVQTSLDKADTAVQPAALNNYQPKGDYQPAGNYKTVQEVVAETGQADSTLVIGQNANGEISVSVEQIAITASQVSGLADIATTGNVNDLVQTEGDILIFNCGTSKIVI